jgi:hypothetical protein
MPKISAKKRRGLAEPRWGWSGVAPLTAAKLSPSDIDLEVLLPGHQSPIGEIMRALRDLGGRYYRYLHQDELGPTRAQRMAALRLLSDQLELLLSRLNGLPEHLRRQLSQHPTFRPSSAATDIDNFEAHCNDKEAVKLVSEAAIDYTSIRGATPPGDARLMGDPCGAAQKTIELLLALDTTTEAAVVLDSELPSLEIAQSGDSDLVGFAIACARIKRLLWRVEQTLDRLEHRGGPERFESLQWLVWELCELYRRETRRPVTNSAMSKNKYTSKPQSPAGRFVLTAVKALQPSEAWGPDPDHRVERARLLDEFVVERAVLYAMRAYVSHHFSSGDRRGRWQRGRVTL